MIEIHSYYIGASRLSLQSQGVSAAILQHSILWQSMAHSSVLYYFLCYYSRYSIVRQPQRHFARTTKPRMPKTSDRLLGLLISGFKASGVRGEGFLTG